ncbi:MAG TPA: bifunctional UDP-N-acetylglucosamine diphosphorylase/glucosamine-1-phosphate N-acetyltransferase GlmU [bacterium]|nr:bifunctional UDP-N-acetylglucosamine diphosphorylase/glucosamine-1-phosphate N-acetyltransferase GlmU [bacterium]
MKLDRWRVPLPTPTIAILLAAGDSTRMGSKTPKVLHPIAGQPMIEYALGNAESLLPERIFVVVGDAKSPVAAAVEKRAVPVIQKDRKGTAHAVAQVLPKLKGFKGNILVHYADACLVRPQTVQALRQFHLLQRSSATLLTARVEDPFGYGRIVRGTDGEVERIVEEKDATQFEKHLNEINGGVYFFSAPALAEALAGIGSPKGPKELYLPDAIPLILSKGGKVHALMVPDRSEVLGINNRQQLAQAHRLWNLRRVEHHQREGVTFLDPGSVEIGPKVAIGRDSLIEGNVQLLGATEIGEDCKIEAGSVIHGSRLGDGVVVRHSRVTDSDLGDGCDAGPFAHVRGGSVLDKYVHVGTNAEIKNSKLGAGTKCGHFSYVGDAQLGKNVNVGAGCVFANFDGKKKHGSSVGDGAFLGSNSTLVAPVKVGAKAVIGAGAVVTRDVRAGTTVVGVPARPKGRK